MNNSSHHIGLYLLVVLIGADIQPIICGIGQEGIVTSNLFKGAIAHQVLYHRSKGIIYNLGPDGWV